MYWNYAKKTTLVSNKLPGNKKTNTMQRFATNTMQRFHAKSQCKGIMQTQWNQWAVIKKSIPSEYCSKWLLNFDCLILYANSNSQ